MTIVIAVLAALLVLGVTENMLHRRALERIPIRILVNGTRGKTTVTRTIAVALNAAGIRTYAKTTGSEARRIDPDGTETEYRAENRPVSIMEQLPFVRLAVRGKAQAIVVECMAQRIENQFLMADKLIRPQYVVLTNAYVDHADGQPLGRERIGERLRLAPRLRHILRRDAEQTAALEAGQRGGTVVDEHGNDGHGRRLLCWC